MNGPGRAWLCRTEHIVAWVLRGAAWQVERPWESKAEDRSAQGPVVLLRRREGDELAREFSGVDELKSWASSGGFWSQD